MRCGAISRGCSNAAGTVFDSVRFRFVSIRPKKNRAARRVYGGVHLKIYPDKIPDNAEKIAVFRSYIVGLARQPEMRARNIKIHPDNVTDVHSHEHDVLQCLDVVLGAINFKLNNKHLLKTARNNTRRGSRTKAKERVFKHIKARIQDIYPRFNVGSNTGKHSDNCYWTDPYRHWLFVPRERIVIDISKHKKK